MIKLFAILVVLAALPFYAVAEQVQTTKSAGIHCTKDAPDSPYTSSAPVAAAPAANEAQIAR